MKKLLCALLALMLLSTMALAEEAKPDTWIADRTITIRTFNGDMGETVPADTINNPVAVELRNRTGISINIEFTAGVSNREMLTTMLAAGDLPDMIVYYLNNSARPEFPILLKAAREGMFYDLTPFIESSKIYSKYLEEGFLPDDTKNQIMWREEFGGATYLLHSRIPRYLGSNDYNYAGGMKIQKSIADALGIDPREVRTQENLYDLLVKIQEGNFTDANGNAVYPIGPCIWGGGYHRTAPVSNYAFGQEGFDIYEGEIMHVVETPFALQQVEFYQKLLAEDLMHPEMFSMDSTRAEEMCRSNSFAIIADSHNYLDIYKTNEYLPLLMNNWKGEYNTSYEGGKNGYGGIAIPKTTEKPEEVFAFVDYLATYEGKLLWKYGVEDVHYTLNEEGNPVPTDWFYDLIQNGEYRDQLNEGVGVVSYWLEYVGNTDVADIDDFGELTWGENKDPHVNDYAVKQFDYIKDTRTVKYVEGFAPTGLLSELPEVQATLSPLLEEVNDIMVQAVFSGSAEAAKGILENYVNLLNSNGLPEFKAFLAERYAANPNAINFVGDK